MEDGEEEEEEDVGEKRKADNEQEGQPEAKERRKEPIDALTGTVVAILWFKKFSVTNY